MMNKKIAVVALCLFAACAPVIGRAQSSSSLLAQIQALQAQLNLLLAQIGGLPAPAVSTAPAVCNGIVFSRNLTVGSTGTDVRCLQAFLNKSADTMLAVSGAGSPGLETLYFGLLTRSAVTRFQSKYSAAIGALSGYRDSVGFVGAATRAELNSLLAQPPIPAGGTGTTGTTGTGTGTGTGSTVGGIVINGQEGAMTVSTYPIPANGTRVYEGDSRDAILGIKVAATGSDLGVQRLSLDFNATPYNYFSTVYLYDGNILLDSMPLNSNTVSRVTSTRYTATLTDFSNPFIVREDTSRVITVKVDVQSGISAGVMPGDSANLIVSVSANGIRAIDQSNLSQFAPGDSISVSRMVNVNHSQSVNATLSVSLNANSPTTGNLIADSNNTISAATLMAFNATAQRDNLTIDDINHVVFATGLGFLVPQTVYLYDDNGTIVDAATPNQSTGVVSFNSLSVEIAGGTTRTFMLKVDDTLASNGSENGSRYRVTVAVKSGDTVYFNVERSNGALLAANGMSGTAISNDQYVYISGPVFSLKSVSTSSLPLTSYSPSAISATFNIQVTAQGSDIYIPKNNGFKVYAVPGNNSTGILVTNTVYRQSNASEFANSYRISQNTTATFTVNSTYSLGGPSGTYYLRVGEIDWGLSDSDPASNAATYFANTFISGFVYLQ